MKVTNDPMLEKEGSFVVSGELAKEIERQADVSARLYYDPNRDSSLVFSYLNKNSRAPVRALKSRFSKALMGILKFDIAEQTDVLHAVQEVEAQFRKTS